MLIMRQILRGHRTDWKTGGAGTGTGGFNDSMGIAFSCLTKVAEKTMFMVDTAN